MKQLLIVIFVLLSLNSIAQIDNEFWFGAPDLTEGTQFESRRDSTIYLVFSSFSNETEIEILQPANLSFEPVIVNLAPNSTDRINLGEFLSLIETKPANQVLNTGLLIRADEPITAYYEIGGANNTDIFSLKGKNSLGTEFYTPFQTEFQNNQTLGGNPYLPPPRAGFVVMATRDTTVVEITPSIDILGHPAGVTFTVELDRGQTYYCEALDGAPESKPGGTRIVSNKEITVTVKDDMIDVEPDNDGGADVIGDQLIASEFLGTDHVAIRGDLVGQHERVVICATTDGTEVIIEDIPVPIELDAGEQYMYELIDEAAFITANENIAVFQVSGQGDQIAGAAVPTLGCTGSNQVGFVRGGPRPFFLNITIRAGAEDQFELNGDPNLVPASAFSEVPGSNGEYVFARIEFNQADIAVGTAHVLTNFSDELFHLATMNGNQASCNYGYFSAFAYLNIGSSAEVCLNDSLVLDAGPGKTSYEWNTGEETQSIVVTEPGLYYVDVFSGSDCFASDSILVFYYEPPIDIGENDTICDGTSTTLSVDGNYLFTWNTGEMTSSIETDTAGIYWVEVTDFQGCAFRDSIQIDVSPRPDTPEVFGETEYCQGETIELSMDDFDDANYRYVLPSGEITFNQNLIIENAQPSDAGEYLGFYIVDGCETFADTVNISVLSSPQFTLGEDVSVCEDVVIVLDPGDVDGTYEWQDGSSNPTFTPAESGTYFLSISNEIGCTSTDSIEVEFRPIPPAPELDIPTSYCVGDDIIIELGGIPNATFTLSVPGRPTYIAPASVFTAADANLDQNGTITLFAEVDECISEITSLDITVNSNPEFELINDTTICDGDEIILMGPAGMDTYNWSTGETSESIFTNEPEISLEVIDANGCTAEASTTITSQGPDADFNILPDTVFTPGTILTFSDLSDPGLFNLESWMWNFGNGDIASSQNPDYAYEESGIFTVTLVVTDELGCEDAATRHVFSTFEFTIPEGFSPNGDGINDEFEILGLETIDGTQVQIFNRWGTIVFESSNYKPGNFWDGDNLPDGTYFYIITLPNEEAISGDITIAR